MFGTLKKPIQRNVSVGAVANRKVVSLAVYLPVFPTPFARYPIFQGSDRYDHRIMSPFIGVF